ncbi:TPA: conjugal transfer protein TraL [Legionella pneumophila]
MARIHMVLQGKGGVGKSFVAATLAQHQINQGKTPLCIDTDPVNTTFASYKGLPVTHLSILDGDEINPRHFDHLIELIAASAHDAIIDNGASAFVPLSHYLISNQIPALLQEMGHELIIHTIITGGQALHDTVNGFAQLARQFEAHVRFIVWLNPYWGPIEHDGKTFEHSKTYQDNKERIFAIIQLPTLKEETFGRDLTEILQERLTFDEALNRSSKTIMTRQRLKIIRDQLFNQLQLAMVM